MNISVLGGIIKNTHLFFLFLTRLYGIKRTLTLSDPKQREN